MFVDVVLPSRQYRVFTYRVPIPFQEYAQVGSTVVVPLGQTVLSGVVVSRDVPIGEPADGGVGRQGYRDVLSVETAKNNDPLSPILIQLTQRVADYYLAPFSSCLPLIIPPQAVKVTSRVWLTDEGRKILHKGSLEADDILVLRLLERRPKGLLRSTFCRSAKLKPAEISRLKKSGWIEERPVIRSSSSEGSKGDMDDVAQGDPWFPQRDPTAWNGEITVGLPAGFERMAELLNSGLFQERICVASEESRWAGLREAITGVLARKRRAIILAPEIQRVEVLASRCRILWGERVGVFHGGLPHAVKAEEWGCVQRGERDLVVGTRSCLFLPLPAVGLIWVEQEEDASYKEEHVPYYHAREVAKMRAELESALVVYSSSLPCVESYARFREQLKFLHISRSKVTSMIEMVDLRQFPFGSILSPVMQEKMAQMIGRGESIILFLNRKGFSQGLLCQDCGHMPECPICHVTLKLFQRPPRLLCSYCGHTRSAPEVCAQCQGTVFKFTGVGTQRVEEEVVRLFPNAVVARVDREQVKTDKEVNRILWSFEQGEIQILIGTEWLFHRRNPPRAALVGLPQADLGLHIPDFRSAERTFQALAQAVRMAKQEKTSGEVILQTRMPDHHVLQAISKQDPTIFYEQELGLRALLGYPPFSHLILLAITGIQPAKVQLVAEYVRIKLERLFSRPNETGSMRGNAFHDSILGPIPSKKSGGTSKKRTLFLLKTRNLPAVRQQINMLQRDYQERFPKLSVVVETHVDPLEIR